MKWYKGGYIITTDSSVLDIRMIHRFLSTQAYWCRGIPFETVQKAVDHSLCFGVFEDDAEIGFARLITDHATFAYLGDVFILPAYRGKGLSKWLVEVVLSHPDVQGLRRILLATGDAHGLYEKFGFSRLKTPDRFMEIHQPELYRRISAGPRREK